MANRGKRAPIDAKTEASVLAEAKARHEAAGLSGLWSKDVVKFNWQEQRKSAGPASAQATTYITAMLVDASGTPTEARVKFFNDVHRGQIAPTTEAEAARLNKLNEGRPGRVVEVRDPKKKASIQIMRWKVSPPVEKADGITIQRDAAGNQMLPPDDQRSDYFAFVELYEEAFVGECEARLARGAALVSAVDAVKKAAAAADATLKKGAADADGALKKAVADAATAAAALAAAPAVAANCPRVPGDVILSIDQARRLRAAFPDGDTLVAAALVVPNTKICRLIQAEISPNARVNAGRPMPNPITRIALDFGRAAFPLKLYDRTKPYTTAAGAQAYEEAKVDGVVVNNDTVHRFITSGSVVDGIVDLSAICISQMGISIPVRLVVGSIQPATASQGLDGCAALYGDGAPPARAPVADDGADAGVDEPADT